MAAGANPMMLKLGIEKAVGVAVEEIAKLLSLLKVKSYCSSCF